MLTLTMALLSAEARAATDADCGDPAFHWSADEPPINVRHVFCGEVRDGRPRGFHSRRLRATAPWVAGIGRPSDEGDGIYSAVVTFAIGGRKLSTFFPDHCEVAEVTRSVRYAATHPMGAHRSWGVIGPSAPDGQAAGYCLGRSGRPFPIRLGLLADGRVNTAFPD